jgi:hypothetical protein
MVDSRLPILIVGATGNLGSLVTKECLKLNKFIVNTLVFDKNEDKCLCEEVAKAGGKCYTGDIMKPESFKGVTKGMHSVICCVLGNEDVFWQGQINLLNECIENNVKRFLPSFFTIDLWNIPKGESRLVDEYHDLRKQIESSNVKGLYISHGIFMESYFWFMRKFGFIYFGDVNQKINLTAELNVAQVVAYALSNPNRFGDIKIFGSEMSTNELCDLYNMISGEKNQPKCLGSLDDLRNKKWSLSEQDFGMDMLCAFLLPVFDGRGRIKNNNNSEFNEIKFWNVEDFLKQSQTKGFNYEFPIPELSQKFEQICKGCK